MPVLEEKVETAYQVGDMVLIRQDLEVAVKYPMLNGKCADVIFNEQMNREKSRVGEIKQVGHGYKLHRDKYTTNWTYTDNMFEGKIVPVTFDGVFDKRAKGNVAIGEEIVITNNHRDIENEFLGKVVTYLGIDKLTGYVKVGLEDDNHAYFLKTHFLGKLVRVAPTVSTEAPEAQNMVEVPKAPEVTEEPSKSKMEVLEMNDTLIPFNIKVERIIFNNPATIVFYKSGKVTPEGYFEHSDKLLKVVAKVSDGDIFDKSRGLDICLLKAFNRESAKMLKAVINPPKKEVK